MAGKERPKASHLPLKHGKMSGSIHLKASVCPVQGAEFQYGSDVKKLRDHSTKLEYYDI